MSWWKPKTWFTRRGMKAANKAIARRRRTAWDNFHRRQETDLNRAMNALAGYEVYPELSDFRQGAMAGRRPGGLAASYDAASPTDNARHWAAADALGANAANSPAVRATLRKRARYEVANNCYARGILLTLANDVVGTGPRIQFDSGVAEIDSFLEARWAAWAKAARLAAKLRTARVAKAQDGEAFVLFTNNPGLRHEVKLDVRLIESEQIATPNLGLADKRHVDGIVFDDAGNPIEYHMLAGHPGEPGQSALAAEPKRIPAAMMFHWFRADRPGQVRGIPEITPALPLFAQLRRFTLATLDAAEAAADFAVLLYTEMPPDQSAMAVRPMSTLDIEKRMMTALPSGWKAGQMKAEHPATTHNMFKRALINEVGRCLNMPYGVAAADSSDYNFASGRLDLLPYRKHLQIDQGDLEAEFLSRLVNAWLDEALERYGITYAPIAALLRERIGWGFVWDSVGYGVNPVDEANARRVDLECGMTNHAREFERLGGDWEVEQERAAKGLGLSLDEYRRRLAEKLLGPFGPAPSSDANRQDDESRQRQQERRQQAERSQQPGQPAGKAA